MDLGCYVLNAARQFGSWLDQAPSVISAEATLKKPDVDSAMWVYLAYPGGVRGRLHWDMNAKARQMVWTVRGTAATAVVPAFAVPTPRQPDRHHSRRQHRGADSWRPEFIHLSAGRAGGHAADRCRVPYRCRRLGCQC
jgi:hypothetical protein